MLISPPPNNIRYSHGPQRLRPITACHVRKLPLSKSVIGTVKVTSK